MVFLFLAVGLSVAGLCNGSPHDISRAAPLLLRRDADPSDLSWIKNIASVGDSYSAGIGCGSRYGGWGDYFCSRYTQSFPAIINGDARLGSSDGRTFTYWPCSGAKTDDVISQTNALAGASQDVITITSGGNDAYLSDILNECVFQWYSDADPLNSKCQDQLTKAHVVIASQDFRTKLDNLINAAKSKLKPGGQIYYVGYAQFFGQDDAQCNDVTWAFWYEYGKREYLTQDKRTQMNTLVVNMNQALQDAVNRAGGSGSGVNFIDYDKYYIEGEGRFCENGLVETSPNRAGLMFYEWNTDESAPETDGLTAQDATSLTVTPGLVMNGTFEAAINGWIQQSLAENPDWQSGYVAASGPPPDVSTVQATDDQLAHGWSSNLVPDGYGRVFHPNANGHQLIANLVLYHIEANYAASLQQSWFAEEITSDTCPAVNNQSDDPPPSDPPPTPMTAQPVVCNNEADFPGHADVNGDAQSDFAQALCGSLQDNYDGGLSLFAPGFSAIDIAGFLNSGVELTYADGYDINYSYMIQWVDGCTTTQPWQSTVDPTGDGSNSCADIFINNWSGCNNGGVGGTTQVGCLKYSFLGALGEAPACDGCVNPPSGFSGASGLSGIF